MPETTSEQFTTVPTAPPSPDRQLHDHFSVIEATPPSETVRQEASLRNVPELPPEQILETVAEEESPNQPTKEVTTNPLHRPPSLPQKIFDRIGFPSFNDKITLVLPLLACLEISFLSTIASSVLINGINQGQITPDLSWLAFTALRGISETILPPAVAAFFIYTGVSARLARNKHGFGRLLTVTKVAASAASITTAQIPELSQERFAGEFHLLGKGVSLLILLRSERDNLVAGLRGLALLAETCEKNDPRLDKINLFYGISPIVTRSFTRFGFSLFPYSPQNRSVARQIIESPVDLINFIIALPLRARFRAHTTRPPQIAIISRDDLIKHKSVIQALLAKIE